MPAPFRSPTALAPARRAAHRARVLGGLSILIVAAGWLAARPAQAADAYVKLGAPGVTLGLSQQMGPQWALRTDFSTIGSIKRDRAEQGIDYKGALKANRIGVFGDWFMTGGFRLTGGLTVNDMSIRLNAQGNGQNITVGGTTVQTDATDQMQVDIRFPRVTPYFGIGWGHHQSDGRGFLFDIGASFGRAKVTETHSGTHLGQISQADYDAELAELRKTVGKIRFMPQLDLGFSARF